MLVVLDKEHGHQPTQVPHLNIIYVVCILVFIWEEFFLTVKEYLAIKHFIEI